MKNVLVFILMTLVSVFNAAACDITSLIADYKLHAWSVYGAPAKTFAATGGLLFMPDSRTVQYRLQTGSGGNQGRPMTGLSQYAVSSACVASFTMIQGGDTYRATLTLGRQTGDDVSVATEATGMLTIKPASGVQFTAPLQIDLIN